MSNLAIEFDKDITFCTTLRVKCVAEQYICVYTESELISAVQYAHEKGIDVHVFGGGSNIAITTPRIKGLVMVNAYKEMNVLEDSNDYVTVNISSGYPVTLLSKETVNKGWAGFEHHLGLPGTMGGAICMNSNWFVDNKPIYVSDTLQSAKLISLNGHIKEVLPEHFNFAYDYSILQETKEIMLNATFKLPKKPVEALIVTMKASHQYRSSSQPKGKPTAGCFFRNISTEQQIAHNLPTVSAGYLIDKAGLKGYTVGGFRVSDVHANFILNEQNGTAEDLHTLTNHIRETVKSTFGIELVNEVIQL